MNSGIKILNEELWVTVDYITQYGISLKMIKSRLSDNRKGKTQNWKNILHPEDKRKKLILYSSIPAKTKAKLPTEEQLLSQIENQQFIEKENTKQNHLKEKVDYCKKVMLLALDSSIRHYPDVKAISPGFTDKKIKITCKNYSIIDTCNDLRCLNEKLVYILGAYHQIRLIEPEIKKLSQTDTTPLRIRMDAVAYNGLKGVIDKRIGSKREKLKFHRELQITFTREYGKPDLKTFNDLKIELDDLCERNEWKKISVSSLKKFYGKNKNRIDATRYGKDHFKKTQRSFLTRSKPLPGSKWVIDGTTLQFVAQDKNGKQLKLQIFVVYDVGSEMVVGYYISRTENRIAVEKALHIAYQNTGYLPAEIVTDNSSAIKSKEVTRLFERFKRVGGVTVRHAKVGNAQDKEIEQFFRTIHKYYRTVAGWIGANVTAHSKSYRPDREHLSLIYKTNGPPDENTLKYKVIQIINQYNCDELNKRKCPARIHSNSEKPYIKKISDTDAVLTFWIDAEYMVRNSQIKRIIGSVPYYYSVYDHDDALKLNGKKVLVKYDNDYLDEVHVFDPQTEEFICTCKLKKISSSAIVEQTDDEKLENIKQNKHNGALQEHINNLNWADQNELDELAGDNDHSITGTFDLRKKQVRESEFQQELKDCGMQGVDPEKVDNKFGKPIPADTGFNEDNDTSLTDNVYDDTESDCKVIGKQKILATNA